MRIGIYDLNKSRVRLTGLAMLCCASLSACVGGEGFSFAPKDSVAGDAEKTGLAVAKTTQTTLARGAVKLSAPKGYCIDKSSVSSGLQGSSALLAKCSTLDGKGANADSAVLSIQISPRRGVDAVAFSSQDLATAALPRKTLKTKQKGNLALAKIASGGDEVFKPADPIHWRGATVLDTRLVLLGLFAPQGSALTSDKGADLLTSLARGLSASRTPLLGLSRTPIEVEGAKSESVQLKTVPKNSATDTVEPAKKGERGLIARLLNRS